MSYQVEIISKGRCVPVSGEELDEVRSKELGWYAYSQARLTRSHDAAVQHLTRFSRNN